MLTLDNPKSHKLAFKLMADFFKTLMRESQTA